MAQLYSNENFPLPVVQELRRLGHDVLTTQESGNAGTAMSDEAALVFAAEKSRSLITLNRKHFVRLHEKGQQHAGIIVCTFDPDFAGQARRVDNAIRASAPLAQRLIRVNRPE